MAQTTAQTPKKIFASRTEEEILKLLKEKGSKNTQQVTRNAVKTLKEFCKFEGEREDFEYFHTAAFENCSVTFNFKCNK